MEYGPRIRPAEMEILRCILKHSSNFRESLSLHSSGCPKKLWKKYCFNALKMLIPLQTSIQHLNNDPWNVVLTNIFFYFFGSTPEMGQAVHSSSSQALQGLILNTVKNKKMEPTVTNPLGTHNHNWLRQDKSLTMTENGKIQKQTNLWQCNNHKQPFIEYGNIC